MKKDKKEQIAHLKKIWLTRHGALHRLGKNSAMYHKLLPWEVTRAKATDG